MSSYMHLLSLLQRPSSGFGSESELGRTGHVKDDELRLEEDVSVDRETDPGVSLDTTEACCIPLDTANKAWNVHLLLPVAGA